MSDSVTAAAVRVDDDMQLDSPRPVVDVLMKESSAPMVHAPPSPAPSGDSQQHTSRPSPSPALNYNTSNADPETSIPSPASPSVSAPLPADVDTPSQLAASSSKHEYEDDAAMDDDADQRPAKRARTADVVSSPPPITPSTPVAPMTHSAIVPSPETIMTTPPPTHTTLSPAQFKFAQSTLRGLRKQKDAFPFNAPVDPVALNIPHYFTYITRPMDFGTIEKKLIASNPAKKLESQNAPSSKEPRYYSIMEFLSDIKLVFDNCFTFNGQDHIVSQCARRLQAYVDRATKNMPPPQPPAPVFKAATPVPRTPAPVASSSSGGPKKNVQARRPSNATPTIRRTDSAAATDFVSARPKREIHAPPPKDIGYEEQPSKRPGGSKVGKSGKRRKDDGTLDQLRFCKRIIEDLYKKQYQSFAQYFYDPVDETYAPKYYQTIKTPMDMSTMKRNLDQKLYADANAFYDDFQIMISNCVRYNPVGTLVYIAGQDLAKAFHEKWRALPPLHTPPPSSDEEEEDDVEPNTIQHLEAQLASIRDTIDVLKTKDKAKAKSKASPSQYTAPQRSASTSSYTKPTAAPRRPPPKKSSSKKSAAGGNGRRQLDADAQLTFEEKKELSETIQNLESPALDEVIQIIHDGVPEIGENTDEIEIEIDALPPAVLRALWNAVIKPKQVAAAPAVAKPFKTGRNQAGTGGLKRKSMDEAAEAEKMRLLEQRISMFDQAVGPTAAGAAAGGAEVKNGSVSTAVNGHENDADSTHSSDSESDSGSSSDSD